MRLELAEVEGSLPEQVVSMAKLLFEQVAALSEQIAGLEKEIRSRTRARADMKRLMTIPGIGPICAVALHAFAPPMESFGCGRDFAAWVGLTPRQHSTAGKQRLGRITKMGQRDLRQLLVLGATSVLRHMRKREELDDPWLRRMIAEKPPKLVAVALANKMARGLLAAPLTDNGEVEHAETLRATRVLAFQISLGPGPWLHRALPPLVRRFIATTAGSDFFRLFIPVHMP